LKIDECISGLESAGAAIESAPQKGFLNLDNISIILRETKSFLQNTSPALKLGEKLTADVITEMKQKIKALKAAGNPLISQAEMLIETESLNYEQLKTLQTEINQAIENVFKGRTRSFKSIGVANQNQSQKPEDYH